MRSVLYEGSLNQKTYKYLLLNVMHFFGSLLCHLQLGAWLCLINSVCISDQVLVKLQPSESKNTEEDSQEKMS